MAQILDLEVNYTPREIPWSVASCKDFEQLWRYFRKDSILLINSKFWADNEFVLKLKLLKLKFPMITIVKVTNSERNKTKSIYYQTICKKKLDDFIVKIKSQTFKPKSAKEDFDKFFSSILNQTKHFN